MVRARGRLRIAHGRSHAARVLARLLRLPRASEAAETRLVITPRADGEQWRRTFDDRRLDTRQYQAGDGELAERIGLLEFRFRLEASDGSLLFRQLEAALLFGSVRLRLPATWAPRVDAREDPAGARQIRVHVRVVLPATWAGADLRWHDRDRGHARMIVALWLLGIQGVIGAFDTVYYHEWRARLPARGKQAASELKLHAARDFFYAVLFATLPWIAWHGHVGRSCSLPSSLRKSSSR